jgi:glycosyltransferase involved in cell wall biosynthesis
LQERAGPNIEFLGSLPDADLKRLYAGCRAFIFPGEEDFGITPLEAQASGRPVIAYGAGGALETVVEGLTGEFFPEQSAEALANVVARFDQRRYDTVAIRRHAEGFDTEVFKRKIEEFIAGKVTEREVEQIAQLAHVR